MTNSGVAGKEGAEGPPPAFPHFLRRQICRQLERGGKWGEGTRLRGRRRGKRDDQGNDQPQRAAQLDIGVFYGAH